jgi:hypothetical protein
MIWVGEGRAISRILDIHLCQSFLRRGVGIKSACCNSFAMRTITMIRLTRIVCGERWAHHATVPKWAAVRKLWYSTHIPSTHSLVHVITIVVSRTFLCCQQFRSFVHLFISFRSISHNSNLNLNSRIIATNRFASCVTRICLKATCHCSLQLFTSQWGNSSAKISWVIYRNFQVLELTAVMREPLPPLALHDSFYCQHSLQIFFRLSEEYINTVFYDAFLTKRTC